MKTFTALTSLLALLSTQSALGSVINVVLSGGQEVPDPVITNVTGTATIELLSDGTIGYSVMLLNPAGIELLGMDGAHLHCAESGANGPVVAFLAEPVTGGRTEMKVDFSGFINATDIIDPTCGATIELLYGSMRAGRVYINVHASDQSDDMNVHSSSNPDGEVRGQIPKVTPEDEAIVISLSGANEVPSIYSNVTGIFTIQHFSDCSLEFSANLTNPDGVELLGVAGAHIHCGPIDGDGPVVAFLAQPVTGGLTQMEVGFSGVIDVTGIVDPSCGATIDLLYDTIMAGGTYVNIHSSSNPDGEVRGQILMSASKRKQLPTSASSGSPHLVFRSAFVGLGVALVTVAAM
jgi:hypothetical protein